MPVPRLAVTPSAISQRIKALEDRLGQVLVVRASPCRPTPAGERLLRRVRPMQALEAEALADFMPAEHARTVPIAVNTDSLETWVLEALAQLHHEHGYLFDVRVDDQQYTLDLLRQGAVLGAITSQAKALQGCNVRPLGTMRYRAIASPALAAKHFAKGVTGEAFATAPMIVFDRKDELQTRFVRRLHPRAGSAAGALPAVVDGLHRGRRARARLVPGTRATDRARAGGEEAGDPRPRLARRAAVLAVRGRPVDGDRQRRQGPARGRETRAALGGDQVLNGA